MEEGFRLDKKPNLHYGKTENIVVFETDKIKSQTVEKHPGLLGGGAESKHLSRCIKVHFPIESTIQDNPELSTTVELRVLTQVTKGQIISKAIFVFLTSSKK